MNCKKCGKPIPSNLNYCPSCSLAENPNCMKYQEKKNNQETNREIINNSPSIEDQTNNEVQQNQVLGKVTNIVSDSTTLVINSLVESQIVGINKNNGPSIENSQNQTSSIKKVTKYILPIYIITIILNILMINGPKFLNITGWDGLVFIIFGQICIQIGTIILSFILTSKFIKKNFNKSEESLSFRVIISVIATYFIYLTISFILSIIFGISTYTNGDYTSNILPIILPLVIIPISYVLNKNNKINKKEANIIIVIIILGEIIKYFVFIGGDLDISSLFETGFLSLWRICSIFHVSIVAVIPAFISGLSLGKPKEENTNKNNMAK